MVHVDHGLRGQESAGDARFVANEATKLGLRFHLRQATLGPGNLEQSARQARQEFFAELITQGIVGRIATGHTRSDQAETVLYRVLRGTGLTGLRGILPVTEQHLIRPLLDVSRLQVESWLRARGVAWREDASNQNRDFVRNRLRHEVLPGLAEVFNPRLEQSLAHLAQIAGDEEAYWDMVVPRLDGLQETICMPVKDLVGAPIAVARRRVRRALEAIKGDLRQIDFQHVETVLAMASSPLGSGRAQLPGLDIFRSFDWIRIAPAGYDNACVRNFSHPVLIPGSIRLPRMVGTVHFQLAELDTARDKVVDELDWQALTVFSEPAHPLQRESAHDALELRNWRPGDHYRRTGQSHGQKLKDLFQQARVPLWQRRHWPVLACGDKIFWTRKFGPAAECAVGQHTSRVLCIRDLAE